jgi:hypothetical protein
MVNVWLQVELNKGSIAVLEDRNANKAAVLFMKMFARRESPFGLHVSKVGKQHVTALTVGFERGGPCECEICEGRKQSQ